MLRTFVWPLFACMLALCASGVHAQESKPTRVQARSIQVPTKQPIARILPDTIKNIGFKSEPQPVDTITNVILRLKTFKKNAHCSYYNNKFNGRRTASGSRFSNNNYTAAHRKLPFGTRLRITNEKNGKSVIVEVVDRGPFSRGREIDLTKKAFMEIADNKTSGSMIVTIEEEVK